MRIGVFPLQSGAGGLLPTRPHHKGYSQVPGQIVKGGTSRKGSHVDSTSHISIMSSQKHKKGSLLAQLLACERF